MSFISASLEFRKHFVFKIDLEFFAEAYILDIWSFQETDFHVMFLIIDSLLRETLQYTIIDFKGTEVWCAGFENFLNIII
jgi:hypothetical protein